MKRLLPPVTLSAFLLLGGCAHYRQSIEAYRSAQPAPFYQKTLEWTGKKGASAPEVSKAIPGAETLEHIETPPAPEDHFETVAAKVFGQPPEWIHERLAVFSSPQAVDDALAAPLDWETTFIAAALLNPEVKAARGRWLAALTQYSQADFLEGLLREYRTFTRYLDTGAGQALNKEMNQAFFPYPSTISLKGEMIREQVRLAELDWERTLRDTLVGIGSIYFDYQFQQRGAGTVQENIDILSNLVSVVQQRVSAGLDSQANLLRVQNDLERQRNVLKDFQSRLRADAARMNALLGREAAAPLGAPNGRDLPYAAPNAKTLTAEALEGRQELRAQEARVARTEIAIRMGEVMNRPLASRGYGTLDKGMMPEASEGAPAPPFAAMPDAARPQPAYAQAEAYLTEMRQRLQAEKDGLEQERAQTRALAQTAIEELDIAHRKSELIENIIVPQYNSAYDIAQSAYSASALTFTELLDTERNLTDSRLERDESRRDQNLAMLRLLSVRGYLKLPAL